MRFNSLYKQLQKLKNDTYGNFGVMAATTALALISGVGLSVDGQRFYSHSAKAQSVADAAGLAAAIHVSSNGGIPVEAAPGVFIEGQNYSATDLGFQLDGGENITFSVEYDNVNREVTVTTTGTVTPLMLQIIGKTEITSSNSTTVKFEKPGEPNPASILFVLDNSGSMWFDDIPLPDPTSGVPDPDAVRRIDALKDSVNSFNDELRAIGGDDQTSQEGSLFLRTGLISYNNGQSGGIVPEEGTQGPIKSETTMDWRVIPAGTPNALSPVGTQAQNIHAMRPFGGTNSGPALERAVQIMVSGSNNEKLAHENHGNSDPTRYVVFMSDGQNDNDNPIWVVDDTTGLFRRPIKRWACIQRNQFNRCTQIGLVDDFEDWDVSIDGLEQGRETPAGSGWEEGLYISSEDQLSRQSCDALKADGVIVYTIGFALEPGFFRTNDWHTSTGVNVPGGSSNLNNVVVETSAERLTRAVGLMQDCASSPDTFLLADNAEQLRLAFQQIGTAFIADVIRLTN